MKISLITTTCDRPFGIRLTEKYIARQTVQPDEWIVADGGQTPATLTMGQTHIHVPSDPGAKNLASNMIRSLEAVTGDVVIVVEDDDHYSPRHIEVSIKHLRNHEATGCRTLNYYNVEHRCWISMGNRGAALCQTAFRASMIGRMLDVSKKCYAANDFCIDGKFWSGIGGGTHDEQTVVGIKGLPGTKGLGIGHRPNSSIRRRWHPDPGFAKLREWIGDDAGEYVNAYHA